MKHYQRGGKYILPGNVYVMTIYMIRDYQRMKDEADAILHRSPAPPDGMPKGTAQVNGVERAAERRETYLRTIRIIDDAMNLIPEEYRKGIWENIQKAKPFPKDAARSTYGMWKSRAINHVAKEINFLE